MPPHLDYGDVIYHILAKINDVSHSITLTKLMDKLEFVLYSAELVITGALKGMSHDKLNLELGWESFNSQRWSRHLALFVKL